MYNQAITNQPIKLFNVLKPTNERKCLKIYNMMFPTSLIFIFQLIFPSGELDPEGCPPRDPVQRNHSLHHRLTGVCEEPSGISGNTFHANH